MGHNIKILEELIHISGHEKDSGITTYHSMVPVTKSFLNGC